MSLATLCRVSRLLCPEPPAGNCLEAMTAVPKTRSSLSHSPWKPRHVAASFQNASVKMSESKRNTCPSCEWTHFRAKGKHSKSHKTDIPPSDSRTVGPESEGLVKKAGRT